jgi:hypothetical protein
MKPIASNIVGIRLDLRVKLLSAKLNVLSNEDKINNASPGGLVTPPPAPIACAKNMLPKKARALAQSQIYTMRVLICIAMRQMENITSSPIIIYWNIDAVFIKSVFDIILNH